MKTTDLFKAMKPLLLCSALLIVIGFGWSKAEATEGGGGMYPNGAEGFMTGALPPPGLYIVEYLNHYSADKLMDGDGDKVPIDFKVDASAAVTRILYQTDKDFLGGNLGGYVLLPLVHMSADTTFGSGTKSGFGDMTVAPFVSWHFGKNLHMASAVDINIPTGAYDKNEIANIGRNYWTIEPVLAVTYLADNGMEVSAKFMYDFNTTNEDTDYESGQEFHFDYALGYHTGPWTFGATGYYYQQVTDDSGTMMPAGVPASVNDGNKGQVFAAGPSIKFDSKGTIVEFRYQREMLAENKPEGDKFWVKLIWPIQ